jgi:hypothetical protein
MNTKKSPSPHLKVGSLSGVVLGMEILLIGTVERMYPLPF